MKQRLTIIVSLFILLIPALARSAGLSPKQVIEKYYGIMMNSCWCCNPHEWSCADSSLFSTLLTKNFNPIGEREELQISLPLRIDNCKENKGIASCDVTYYIIGQMTNIFGVPFAEKNRKEKVTLHLIKESGLWKIKSIVHDGMDRTVDGSNVVSVSYILKDINKDIHHIRTILQEKQSKSGNESDLLKERLSSLEEAKKIILKRVKYGVKAWD